MCTAHLKAFSDKAGKYGFPSREQPKGPGDALGRSGGRAPSVQSQQHRPEVARGSGPCLLTCPSVGLQQHSRNHRISACGEKSAWGNLQAPWSSSWDPPTLPTWEPASATKCAPIWHPYLLQGLAHPQTLLEQTEKWSSFLGKTRNKTNFCKIPIQLESQHKE